MCRASSEGIDDMGEGDLAQGVIQGREAEELPQRRVGHRLETFRVKPHGGRCGFPLGLGLEFRVKSLWVEFGASG